MSNYERRCRLRAFAPACRPPPAVVLPNWRVVFLALGSFFLPFFKRDFRLKKRSKCPSWRSSALCRTRCQGRGFCVHRSEVESLDSKAGGEAHSCARKGKGGGSFRGGLQIANGCGLLPGRGQCPVCWLQRTDHLGVGCGVNRERQKRDCGRSGTQVLKVSNFLVNQ